MTLGHVVGTRLKRSLKAAKLKQLLLFQPIRLTIELNTKSKLKAWTSCSYIHFWYILSSTVRPESGLLVGHVTGFDRSTRGRSFGQTRDSRCLFGMSHWLRPSRSLLACRSARNTTLLLLRTRLEFLFCKFHLLSYHEWRGANSQRTSYSSGGPYRIRRSRNAVTLFRLSKRAGSGRKESSSMCCG